MNKTSTGVASRRASPPLHRLLIINQNAGTSVTRRRILKITQHILDLPGKMEIVAAKSRLEIMETARQAAEGGVQQISGIGGDGTNNGIINGIHKSDGSGLINPNILFALLPSGTANDFSYVSGGPHRLSQWADSLWNYEITPCDVGLTRFLHPRSRIERIYFLNSCSAGLGYDVVRRKELCRVPIPRRIRYPWHIITTLPFYRPTMVRLTITRGDDTTATLDANLIHLMMSKGSRTGGHIRIGGNVTLDDGLLDVRVFEKMGVFSLMRSLPRVFGIGRFKNVPEMKSLQATRVKAESLDPDFHVFFESDGIYGGEDPAEVSIASQKLKFCMPKIQTRH